MPFNSCRDKFNKVTAAVIALPRNNYGTNNEGSAATYSDQINKIAQSSAPFVGIDGFWFSSSDLGLVPKDQIKSPITEAQVVAAIAKVCPDKGAGPAGDKLKALRVCPDAAYMHSFLWQKNTPEAGGLFGAGSKATYDGVVPSKINKQAILTWSRGYLLMKYAK